MFAAPGHSPLENAPPEHPPEVALHVPPRCAHAETAVRASDCTSDASSDGDSRGKEGAASATNDGACSVCCCCCKRARGASCHRSTKQRNSDHKTAYRTEKCNMSHMRSPIVGAAVPPRCCCHRSQVCLQLTACAPCNSPMHSATTIMPTTASASRRADDDRARGIRSDG